MKTEKALSIVFIISLIFKLMHWPGANILMILSLLSLALCYFPFGFYFFSDKNMKTQNIGISIVFGWTLSVCIIGILFKLMFWPGYDPMLLIGTLVSLPLLGVAVLLFVKSSELLKNYYKNLLIRTSILVVISLLFYLLPNSVLINHYFANEPELRELYLKEQENPDDETIQQEIQAYHAKRFEKENGRQNK